MKAEPSLWYDVTGVLRWGAQFPTGIQRVEEQLAAFAVRSPDTGLVAFDFQTMRYAPVTPAERAYLEHILRHAESPPVAMPLLRRIRYAFSHLRTQVAFNNVESGRRIAAEITRDPSGRSTAFVVVKSLTRLLLWTAAGVDAVWSRTFARLAAGPQGARAAWKQPGALCLVSHPVTLRPELPEAARHAGLRLFFIIHDLIPVMDDAYAATRFASRFAEFMKFALTGAEPITTLSHAVAADVEAWGREKLGLERLPEIEICPYRNPIDSPHAVSRPIPQLEGKRFVLFCSTIAARKNQHVLVRVWTRLAAETAADDLPHLVLVGRPSKGYDAMDAAMRDAGPVADHIHVLHDIDDAQLRWAYRHADFGVFPSGAEGWGLGVSECLAAGLPVVLSDLPALNEAAQGLMPALPPGDVDAWFAYLRGLIGDRAEIGRLRLRARADYVAGPPDGFASDVFGKIRSRVRPFPIEVR